jgi:urea transporter
MLFLVTFLTPSVGIFGLLGVVLINLIARVGSLNKYEIQQGLFGLNALFLGMALGHNFQSTWLFVLFFVAAVFMLLIATVLFKELLAIHKLPFLVLPFLFTYWIISISSPSFTFLIVNHYNPSLISNTFFKQPWIISKLIGYLYLIPMPHIGDVFFHTLSGALFQQSYLGGIVIAIGLFYSSRIAFSLSLIGFFIAYMFYTLFGANVNDFNNNLLGANYVFMAISMGCFYVIPSSYSYLNVVMFIPIQMLMVMFLGKMLAVFNVDAFTLPYCIVCIVFLFTLQFRWLRKYIHLTEVQYFMPEKNIYKYLNSIKRLRMEHLPKIALPFSGEWLVTQSYNGNITHVGEWNNALDFVMSNEELKTFKYQGACIDEYGCYNKPVLAPFDGYVYDILNNVEDNYIGIVNVGSNWGNTIVINHLNGLYSQISHLKKDSFQVSVGEYVKKGRVLATCGNSGLSHEPHVHFQLQTTPEIGAKTLFHPLSYFIEKHDGKSELKAFEIPTEKSFVSNVVPSVPLSECYNFYPGRKFIFKNESTNALSNWEVLTDGLNRHYIYCYETNSYAYFVNDGTMFYFTDFEGDRKSLLYYFYLATYRQLLGYYEKIDVTDEVPLIQFRCRWLTWLQDLFVPFFTFMRAEYTSRFVYADDQFSPRIIVFKSSVSVMLFKRAIRKINFEFEIRNNAFRYFAVTQNKKRENYICVS